MGEVYREENRGVGGFGADVVGHDYGCHILVNGSLMAAKVRGGPRTLRFQGFS